jgi:hypothetical protein
MRTNATATLRATMLCAALVTVALTALPAFAAGDSAGCSPATCTSPVLGPANHPFDVETR